MNIAIVADPSSSIFSLPNGLFGGFSYQGTLSNQTIAPTTISNSLFHDFFASYGILSSFISVATLELNIQASLQSTYIASNSSAQSQIVSLVQQIVSNIGSSGTYLNSSFSFTNLTGSNNASVAQGLTNQLCSMTTAVLHSSSKLQFVASVASVLQSLLPVSHPGVFIQGISCGPLYPLDVNPLDPAVFTLNVTLTVLLAISPLSSGIVFSAANVALQQAVLGAATSMLSLLGLLFALVSCSFFRCLFNLSL